MMKLNMKIMRRNSGVNLGDDGEDKVVKCDDDDVVDGTPVF